MILIYIIRILYIYSIYPCHFQSQESMHAVFHGFSWFSGVWGWWRIFYLDLTHFLLKPWNDMLKLESLDPVARRLLDGETCTLSKTVPQLVRGARPSTESATRIRREVCIFRTVLLFDAPVTITSIALWGSNLLELRTTTLVLELKGCGAAVQFALDLSGPQTNHVRFLSPLGLKSYQDFELFLCDDRLRTDTSAKLDLTRLEIVHFRAANSEIPGIPDDTNSLDPTSDMVSFEFEGDSETIKANKFVLAAHSPVFKRQFFGNCVEAMTGRVAVTDFSSVSFRLFLSMLLDSHVAYTLLHTPADVNMLNMVEVWAIADKYCAKDVRNIAEAALLQSAGPQNVKELLQSCRRYCSAESLGPASTQPFWPFRPWTCAMVMIMVR